MLWQCYDHASISVLGVLTVGDSDSLDSTAGERYREHHDNGQCESESQGGHWCQRVFLYEGVVGEPLFDSALGQGVDPPAASMNTLSTKAAVVNISMNTPCVLLVPFPRVTPTASEPGVRALRSAAATTPPSIWAADTT